MKDYATAKQRINIFKLKHKIYLDIVQDIAFIKRGIKQWKSERALNIANKRLYDIKELRGAK